MSNRAATGEDLVWLAEVAKVVAAVVGVALIAAGGAISFVGAAIGGLVSLIMGVVAVFKTLVAEVRPLLRLWLTLWRPLRDAERSLSLAPWIR
jgi:hypothetical protein